MTKKPDIVITIPQYTEDEYTKLYDSLFQCGQPEVDWTISQFNQGNKDKTTCRFKVTTYMIETVKEICWHNGYLFRML